MVVCFDLLGLGVPGWLVLRADGEHRALAGALAAALAWSCVRAARGRYSLRATGRPPG
ncbi:sugar transferase, partial [Streptomyces sp. SID11233]|nr:sugar transferase [Streptomyces sp. SID11233]